MSNPSPPCVRLRLLPDRVAMIIAGELTAESVQPVLLDMGQAISYYRYSNVQFLVNSPGGELAALLLIEQSMQWWRGMGARIVTSSWGRAHSAAALLVSMGDPGWRLVRAGTSLLYHQSRFQFKEPVTIGPAGLEEMLHDQERFLRRYVEILAQRIGGETADRAPTRAPSLPPSSVRCAGPGDAGTAASALVTPASTPTERFADLLRREPILSAEEAHNLRLVDHVISGPHDELAHLFASLL